MMRSRRARCVAVSASGAGPAGPRWAVLASELVTDPTFRPQGAAKLAPVPVLAARPTRTGLSNKQEPVLARSGRDRGRSAQLSQAVDGRGPAQRKPTCAVGESLATGMRAAGR